MDSNLVDPLGIPEILSLVLEFCDLETLKNSRLVNKTWYETSARSIRRKSIINLTNHNLSSIVRTLDDSVNLFSTTHSFPATSLRIQQSLDDSPAFFRLFNDYVKLVQSLEISCVTMYESFFQCQSIDFNRSHVLSSLKDLKVTSTYHEWYHHMTKAEERVHVRKCVCETILSMAPNLQKLHLDLRLGPSEWATFLKSAAGRLKGLKKLYFQLFVSEDTDEYYADGKFIKDVVLDQVFLEGFPKLIREIGPEIFQIDSLSLDILNDIRLGEVRLEIMQGVLEFVGLFRSILNHFHLRSICHHPQHSYKWADLGRSFPLMNHLETCKIEFLYSQEPVLPNVPMNRAFPKLRKFSMVLASQIDHLDQLDIQEWIDSFTGTLEGGNKTITELDLEYFSLVGFSSKVLPELAKHFLVLKVLKVDFHPTCKLGTENWVTICKDLRRLEVLSVRVLNGDKDYYAIQCDGTGTASKLGQVLAEDGINWTKVLTGIPEEVIRQIKEDKESEETIDDLELQRLRVCPSLVDLENLQVLKIIDKSPTGILNDDICQFGFMKMKRLKQLHLNTTENISDQCLQAMKSVLDIYIVPVEDSVDTSSVIDEAVEGDSFSDSDF